MAERPDKKDCDRPQPCLCDRCPKCGTHKTVLLRNLASHCYDCHLSWL